MFVGFCGQSEYGGWRIGNRCRKGQSSQLARRDQRLQFGKQTSGDAARGGKILCFLVESGDFPLQLGSK